MPKQTRHRTEARPPTATAAAAPYADALQRGITLHQAGRIDDALALYKQVLEIDDRQPDALNLAGVAKYQTGDAESAVSLLRQATVYAPRSADAHSNLGNVLRAMGRTSEALIAYQRAVALKPDFAEAHNNLGTALRMLDRPEDAVRSYRQAIALKPDYADAHGNLGNAMLDLGAHDEAVAAYRAAIGADPSNADAHYNLGLALHRTGHAEEAEASFQRAVDLNPAHADALFNLGVVLGEREDVAAAANAYRRCLAARPDFAPAHLNLGVALRTMGDLAEAERALRRAVEIQPALAEAHSNLGAVLEEQGRIDAARDCHDRAVALQPQSAQMRYNRAITRLLAGDFAGGWSDYEHRWGVAAFSAAEPVVDSPVWDGTPLAGRTLLLHAEQGLGDAIQFARLAAGVPRQDGRVVLQCPPKLRRLFDGVAGVNQVVPRGADLPPYDLRCPLMSLPERLAIDADSIPADIPYLRADPERVEGWRDRVRAVDGYRVGIVWRGSPTYRRDRDRSVPLSAFLPLARLPGVRLVSLQTGDGRAQLDDLPPDAEIADFAADLDDTAAIMQHLDLVVSIDSALGHLAGALGRPVWLALPFAPDWRWLLTREDTPWYPTMRLFRQTARGDWDGVFARMAAALQARLADTDT